MPHCRSAGRVAGALLGALVLAAGGVRTAAAQWPASWTEPYPAFRIAPNLYYVGSRGLANYLITTPQGHILINSDLEANVPLIRASIESLGFKFSDVKILLISHAHWDHNAGSALIKKLTGAAYMVMDADVDVVESGGKTDFQYGGDTSTQYPATKVDRVLHDGDEVKLGDALLVAHHTPGHTKGTTTWAMKVTEGGRERHVVIVGSPNVNDGYNLVNNPKYPSIVQDYERGFRLLHSLPCDYFLGAHGSYFDMEAKYAKMKSGDGAAFIDPDGYESFVLDRERAYRAELARQQGSNKAPASKALPQASERAAVIAVADSALAAISRSDFVALSDLMLDSAITSSARIVNGESRISFKSRTGTRTTKPNGTITERGFRPSVHISGSLAVVWMPYDLYLNGAWSHCGVDTFTLLNGAAGWRISSLSWSVEQPPACERHPDGPPRP